jgi:hypothetical protein
MRSSADGTSKSRRIGSSRVFGSGEPPHIHVRRENMVAKVWLEPIALERAEASAERS